MMKTKKEFIALKGEADALNKEFTKLDEDEMICVTGGVGNYDKKDIDNR